MFIKKRGLVWLTVDMEKDGSREEGNVVARDLNGRITSVEAGYAFSY